MIGAFMLVVTFIILFNLLACYRCFCQVDQEKSVVETIVVVITNIFFNQLLVSRI